MVLEVIVTSGETISKLDDVRHIGNFSKGTTGAIIAEEFLKTGAIVHYVYGKGAKRPFRSALAVNPAKPKEEELERIAQAYDIFHQHAGRLHEYGIETFEEYYDAVKKLLPGSDAIVLAAAVGDYGGIGQEGKISSEDEVLRLELTRNPKVISLVKQWNPKVFQVGFKLLSRSSLDDLIDAAYQHGIKNHSDLTVANTLIDGDSKKRATVLITPEKGLIPVSLPKLAPKLVELVNQRISKSHYRTKVNLLPLPDEIFVFRNYARKLYGLNLFEPYFNNSDMQFGFVAARVPNGGFLITSRGSNKMEMPFKDVVHVPRIDFDSLTVYVNSSGKKASLNANVAGKIFEKRPEVNIVLHAHVFPGFSNKTSADYAPGTQEDVDEVVSHLGNEPSVELVNHGIISVGRTLDDIIATLDVEPAYVNFPELYDAIYHRFQGSAEFFDLVGKTVACDEAVLDLAAGTGDVSMELQKRGYRNISLADQSLGMLKVARGKLGDVPTYVTSMRGMNLGKTYDAVIIRQAINYLMDYDGLVDGLSAMRAHLNDSGRLIFNAPNFNGSPGERSLEYEHGDYNVKVKEMNAVEGRIITHTQNCILMKKDGSEIRKVYDLNRFGMFTREEFAQALREAGFKSVKFYGKGLNDYTSESKTIYCVAKK